MNCEPIDRGEHRREREKHHLATGNTGNTHRLSSYSSLPLFLFSFIVSHCIDFIFRDASEFFDSFFFLFSFFETIRREIDTAQDFDQFSIGNFCFSWRSFLGDLSWKCSQGLSSIFPTVSSEGNP